MRARRGTWQAMVRRLTILAAVTVGMANTAVAQFTLTGSTYSQDFNGLGTTSGTVTDRNLNNLSSTLNGWFFHEVGSNANNVITAGNGSNSAGDTYNFGVTGNADRALGGLRSSSLNPSWGFWITNATGNTITGLQLSYVGEVWRVGATGRSDQLDFSYSTSSTSLSGTSWTDFNGLDYVAPTFAATTSGSLIASATVSGTISSLSLANGSQLFLRWSDFDATGADDGLAIDTFSLVASLQAVGTYWAPAAGGGGSGTWSAAGATWAAAAGQQGTGSQASSGTLVFGNAPGTVTVSGSVSAVAGMQITTSGYAFDGGTIGLVGGNASANSITTGTGVSATIGSVLTGSTGLTKAGPGTLTLTASNAFTGGVTVAAGRLVIGPGSSLAGGAVVDGVLGGGGLLAGTVSGSGAIDPGASPGILTAGAVDPSAGLDHNFEFTALAPDYTTTGTAALNDVLHLTAATPFTTALSAAAGNAVNVYFNLASGSLSQGQTIVGGFFADSAASSSAFLADVAGAQFNFFVASAGGGTTYEGVSYRSLADWNALTSQSLQIAVGGTTATSAAFPTGTTNGFVTTFAVVPEPSALALAGLAPAAAGWVAWRRRRSRAAQASSARRFPAAP